MSVKRQHHESRVPGWWHSRRALAGCVAAGVIVLAGLAWFVPTLLHSPGAASPASPVAGPVSVPVRVCGNNAILGGGPSSPPKGAVVPSVPESSTTAYGGGKNYSYSNGVFYEPAAQGYKIVQPPVGVLVTSIPKGATTVTVNGANYLEFGGVWYRPFYSGSDVVYQTVPNPTG